MAPHRLTYNFGRNSATLPTTYQTPKNGHPWLQFHKAHKLIPRHIRVAVSQIDTKIQIDAVIKIQRLIRKKIQHKETSRRLLL